MTSHLQQQLHPEGSQREVELEEERRRQEISVVHQSCNTSDYFNEDTSSLQLPSPSLFRSGGQFQNQEVSDDSDQVPSSSLQLHPSLSPSASPSAPQFYYQGSPQSSSITSRPSIVSSPIYLQLMLDKVLECLSGQWNNVSRLTGNGSHI